MLTLILRFLHVFFGAIWVGMAVYATFFLMPAFAEAGPDAGKVMAALGKKRVPVIMPIIALITIVSGMWLLQRMSGGNMQALMATPMGQAFAWGGASALVAFLIGIVVGRPVMMRSAKLAAELPTAPPERRAAVSAELQRLRARGSLLGNVVTIMLMFTLAAMAVARYL